MDPLFTLNDEVVVITGSSGRLGQAYVETILNRGAKVAGLDLMPAPPPSSGELFFQKADVTNKKSLVAALQAIRDNLGEPTVLINNAALDSPPSAPPEENGPFETYPENAWDRILDVNLKGVFLGCQIFGGAMAEAGRGAIINISSIYGLVSPDQSLYEYRRTKGENFYKPVAYSASKSGLLNLTRYLAVYWAGQGVRVNTLTLAGVFNHQDDEFLVKYTSRIPVGRMAEADDYFGPLVFLASSASKYMTGSNLVIDGGWTAI